MRMNDFEGDGAAEFLVESFIDGAHPPLSDELLNFVVSGIYGADHLQSREWRR
jgi:hypothetical protein